MVRGLRVAAVVAAVACVLPASSFAATVAGAPTLTSAPFVKPATMSWTPAVDPGPPDSNTGQEVYRSDGVCPAGNVLAGAPIASYDIATTTYTTGDTIPDGVYCFHIHTTSRHTPASDGPGLTITIDTTDPSATVLIEPTAAGNVLSGIVTVIGTSSDAVSGVDSSTFRIGPVGGCTTGVAIPASWNTTTVVNGTYQVCNVVIDRAGHVTTSATTVTVANAMQPPAPVAAPGQPATPATRITPPVIPNPAIDPTAPEAPRNVTYTLPKTSSATGNVAVKLHWVKPTASDLAKVVVILNLRRAPRSPIDGTKIYSGLGTSASLKLKVGGSCYVGLFAYDTSRNISSPALKLISLAPLIPLRPTSGSSLTTAPRLTWKARASTAYYNVQVFRNGVRVLTGWPTRAAYSLPAGKLTKGNYVWFVWPAVKHGSGPPTFAQLIGRATFKYTGG
jgi:hypothetical protein